MAGLVPPTTAAAAATATALPVPPKKTEDEKVDYLNLPCPIPYEEIHREAFSKFLFSKTDAFVTELSCLMFMICYDSVFEAGAF